MILINGTIFQSSLTPEKSCGCEDTALRCYHGAEGRRWRPRRPRLCYLLDGATWYLRIFEHAMRSECWENLLQADTRRVVDTLDRARNFCFKTTTPTTTAHRLAHVTSLFMTFFIWGRKFCGRGLCISPSISSILSDLIRRFISLRLRRLVL